MWSTPHLETSDVSAGGECRKLKLTQNITQRLNELQNLPYSPQHDSLGLSPQLSSFVSSAHLCLVGRLGLRGHWEQF